MRPWRTDESTRPISGTGPDRREAALDERQREADQRKRALDERWRALGEMVETLEQRSREAIGLSSGGARDLKHTPAPRWQNPENLTSRQKAKLAWTGETRPCLWRAYLFNEGLRLPFQLNGEEGKYALARWLSWASRPGCGHSTGPPSPTPRSGQAPR